MSLAHPGREVIMPLKVIDYGPGERPAIFCDACGREITHAADGNYHWHSQVERR